MGSLHGRVARPSCLAERGRYDEALAQAEMILGRPPAGPSRLITASVAAAAVEMRRGGDGSGACSRRPPSWPLWAPVRSSDSCRSRRPAPRPRGWPRQHREP